MSKSAQLEQLERAARWVYIVVALCAAGALFFVWLLLNERKLLDQIGFTVFVLVFGLFAGVIHMGAVMSRKAIAALDSPPTLVDVTISATPLETTTEYTAQLEWQGQRWLLPLAAQPAVLNPLVHQPVTLRAYADRRSGLPVMLETKDAYLWLKAPPRRA